MKFVVETGLHISEDSEHLVYIRRKWADHKWSVDHKRGRQTKTGQTEDIYREIQRKEKDSIACIVDPLVVERTGVQKKQAPKIL